mmetsp:Transcript_28117/g.58947  ORF Transcript_28117/g.58947 Transcript_28117/m.58947 type:complete len:306 (-) Transcript_28117:499-1416(-)
MRTRNRNRTHSSLPLVSVAVLAAVLLPSMLMIESSLAFLSPMGVGVRVRVRGSSPRTPLSPSSTITRTSAAEEAIERATATAPLSIVEECYAAWNCRDTKAASECFATKFTYDDGQFLGTIRNDKSRLAKHFETGARLLPPDSVLVLDSIAVCPTTNNIGTRWHVEETDGTVVPRTRGCSFYTVDSESGLIASGFRVSEMVLKPSKTFSNGLVSSASRFTTAAGGATTTTTTTSTSDALASASRTTTVAPTTTTTTTTTIFLQFRPNGVLLLSCNNSVQGILFDDAPFVFFVVGNNISIIIVNRR